MINQLKFLFDRRLRLLNRQDFNVVFDKAQRLSSRYITLLYRPNDLGHPRIGLVIAKKSLAKAVQRNTFKRITRDSFRRYQHELPGIDVVIISKKGLKTFERGELGRQLNIFWSKLSQLS